MCNRVQPQNHDMENTDTVDNLTPTGGGSKDITPPYIRGGRCIRPVSLNRTEEVRGSNPLRSTFLPPLVGVFH